MEARESAGVAHCVVAVVTRDVDMATRLPSGLRYLGHLARVSADGVCGMPDVWDVTVLDATEPSSRDDMRAEVDRLSRQAPVIVLVPSREWTEAALRAGASDCVSAPVRMRELHSRIRALVRRVGRGAGCAAGDDAIGDALIDLTTPRPEWLGDVELTPNELVVLRTLVARKESFVRQDFLLALLGMPRNPRTVRAVSGYVRRLRSILEEIPGLELTIDTIRGAGYRLRSVSDFAEVID